MIADTIYENDEAKKNFIREVEESGEITLAHTLKNEFSSTETLLTELFENEGFKVTYQQMNKFVWILTAKLD